MVRMTEVVHGKSLAQTPALAWQALFSVVGHKVEYLVPGPNLTFLGSDPSSIAS